MSAHQTQSDSKLRKRSIVGELRLLIRSLQGLYSQVSSRRLHTRLQTRPRLAESRSGIAIEDLLGENIDRTAEAARKAGLVVMDKEAVETESLSTRSQSAAEVPPSPTPGSGFFDALSQHFGHHRGATLSQPLLHEKMRSNTLEHINRAMTLARVGDTAGAKIHAGLAASAMRTAGQYMSDEEFTLFQEQVEGRLQAVSKADSQGNP